MLEITQDAENAIRSIRAEGEFPESTALRIAPVPTTDGGLAIGLAFTDGPEAGDHEVSAKADFTVYISPELADAFQTASLKLTGDDEGVELEIHTQAELHDHGGHGDDTLPKMLLARRGSGATPGQGWF